MKKRKDTVYRLKLTNYEMRVMVNPIFPKNTNNAHKK